MGSHSSGKIFKTTRERERERERSGFSLIFIFIFIGFPIFSCSCFTQSLSVTLSVYAWHWAFLFPLENVSQHFSTFCVPLKFIVAYRPISDIISIDVGVKFHVLQIEALKAAGVDEVVLAINYQPEVGTYAPASCSRTKSQKESWNLPVSCSSYDNSSLVPICNMQVLVLSVVGGRAGDDELSG